MAFKIGGILDALSKLLQKVESATFAGTYDRTLHSNEAIREAIDEIDGGGGGGGTTPLPLYEIASQIREIMGTYDVIMGAVCHVKNDLWAAIVGETTTDDIDGIFFRMNNGLITNITAAPAALDTNAYFDGPAFGLTLVCHDPDNLAVVANWTDTPASYYGETRAFKVNDEATLTITMGSTQRLTGSTINSNKQYVRPIVLGGGRVMYTFRDSGDGDLWSQVIKWTSGTTVDTAGTPVEIDANNNTHSWPALLGTDKVGIAWFDDTANHVSVRATTVSDTTIATWGAKLELSAVSTEKVWAAVGIAEDVMAVIITTDNVAPENDYVAFCAADGTTMSEIGEYQNRQIYGRDPADYGLPNQTDDVGCDLKYNSSTGELIFLTNDSTANTPTILFGRVTAGEDDYSVQWLPGGVNLPINNDFADWIGIGINETTGELAVIVGDQSDSGKPVLIGMRKRSDSEASDMVATSGDRLDTNTPSGSDDLFSVQSSASINTFGTDLGVTVNYDGFITQIDAWQNHAIDAKDCVLEVCIGGSTTVRSAIYRISGFTSATSGVRVIQFIPHFPRPVRAGQMITVRIADAQATALNYKVNIMIEASAPTLQT